jgi:hypothetical protein
MSSQGNYKRNHWLVYEENFAHYSW